MRLTLFSAAGVVTTHTFTLSLHDALPILDGLIREIFSQKNWERAYDKHDNAFRLSVFLDERAGGKSIDKIKFVRKAVLFWTRNPKLSYRVWISIKIGRASCRERV